MRVSVALIAIVVSLPAVALAQPRWTFCIASSKSGADVWITDVFAAERDRVELESAFKAMLGVPALRAPTLVVRCRARTRRKPSTPNSRPRVQPETWRDVARRVGRRFTAAALAVATRKSA